MSITAWRALVGPFRPPVLYGAVFTALITGVAGGPPQRLSKLPAPLSGSRPGAAVEQDRQFTADLLAGNPSARIGRRDLSVSYDRVGDVQLSQGDLAGNHQIAALIK